MDLDRLYALAKRVRQRLHCSAQTAEYIASILAWQHAVTEPRFEVLAEIQAIHSIRSRSTTRSGRD
jgi:hypothetical protein